MRILNTNSHRVYVDGAKVPSGQVVEGDERELDRDGLIDADSSEGQAWLEAHGTVAEADTTLLDSTQTVSDVSLLGRSLATARLRDKLDPATETTIKGTGEGRLNNQPSVGGPAEVVPEAVVTDPNLPPPASGGEGAVVTTGAPGHDEIADERSHTAPAVLGRLGADESLASDEAERAREGSPAEDASPSYDEDVVFTSGSAENKADELVAAGKLDASSLEPGKGSGADGAYTVKDVEAAAN